MRLLAASLPRNTHSDMSLPKRFGGMGVGDLIALADIAHVGATSLAVGSAIRFLTTQDGCMREINHDDVPMEPTMYGRLATVVIKTVSHRPNAPDGDGDHNESIWSLELASVWARLNANTCVSHPLAESKPLITTAVAKRPTAPPETPNGGSRKLRSRSPIKQRAYYPDP